VLAFPEAANPIDDEGDDLGRRRVEITGVCRGRSKVPTELVKRTQSHVACVIERVRCDLASLTHASRKLLRRRK
jgi:hypothetical protein